MSARVHAEWRSRVAAEYRSAAITARVVHWSIQCGLPDELLRTGLRIVGDELTHAELCHDCMVTLGGADDPVNLPPESLAPPTAPEGVGASLIDAVLLNFCFGETFAVPLFNAMRKTTTHPAALAVLERVLRDEAIHRAFGWDTLDALLELDEPAVRDRVVAQLPSAVRAYRLAYATEVSAPPLSAEERAAGLMEPATYAEVFHHTLQNDIAQRLARRNIQLPEMA